MLNEKNNQDNEFEENFKEPENIEEFLDMLEELNEPGFII